MPEDEYKEYERAMLKYSKRTLIETLFNMAKILVQLAEVVETGMVIDVDKISKN